MRSAGRPRGWKRGVLFVVAALVVVAALAAIYGVIFFKRDVPETYENVDDHFKYGSIGAEARAGVPYWIWLVLPDVFAEHLPDGVGEGYERMGFIYESEDRIRPVGTSLREKPIPLVGLNCAACHTAVVRDSPDAAPRIVLATAGHQFDIQEYFDFLFDCARDQRFDADTLIPAIRKVNPDFSRDWIVQSWLFQEPAAQPVVLPDHRDRMPPYSTPVPGLLLANTTQVYPDDRGTNYAIREADEAVAELLARQPELAGAAV